jgi:hypothetical protein
MKEQTSARDIFRERSPNVVALDNLIRRKLRVSDPSDPVEIAGALKNLYQSEKEALEREAAGVPYMQAVSPSVMPVAARSSQVEVDQAVSDVERDLKTLTTNSLLKDIEPELNGWASAIRAAVADGINAARQGLDPRQRDLAFANRRLLGDYARVARFVGALTPNMSMYYRRMAQSLDEVAGVILVLMGEALANMGYGGGRFLLQVTVSEFQERRDAVIYALRNLIGSTQEAYGPQEWPRGLVAYRQFLERLEASGQSDLRVLFQETNLARLMDDLIHRAAGGRAEGVRALGATAQLSLDSLRRLLMFGRNRVSPESPPLVAFLSAVQLFLDAFGNSASGCRLLFLSRPPIVFYGLYGIGGPDKPTEILLELVMARGKLAELLDCYLRCGCEPGAVCCQILLDKILYDLDRAIDLYVRGTDPNGEGEPEHRAAAFGFIIDKTITDTNSSLEPEDTGEGVIDSCASPCKAADLVASIRDLLEEIRDEHLWHEAFNLSKSVEQISMKVNGNFSQLVKERNKLNKSIGNSALSPGEREIALGWLNDLNGLLKPLSQELCIQRAAEEQWENLLLTMAPSCIRFNGNVLTPTKCVIDNAIKTVTGETTAECPTFEPSIPPTVETSLDSIVDDVSRKGEGRQNK